MSGAEPLRFALVIPSGRMRPALTCGSSDGADPNMTSIRPPTMSGTVDGAALVGHVQHVDAGLHPEELHREVQSAADARGRVDELSRARLRQRDELLDALYRKRRVDDEQIRRNAKHAHHLEITRHVERHAFLQEMVGGNGRVEHQKRV